jgi:hypothetical protein
MTVATLNIQWKVEISTKDLRDYMKSQKRLQPWCCVIGTKQAEWMEFGTSPATRADCEYPSMSDPQFYVMKGRGKNRKPTFDPVLYYKEVYRRSEFYRNIYDWVNLKGAPNVSQKEKYEIAWRMCRIIAKNGLKPRPFFRPAFYYMCAHIQEWWNDG